MTPDNIYILIYIVILLALSSFFSGMEIAYLTSDKLRIELDRNRGGITGRILTILFRNPNNYITTILVGNNIVLVMYGLFMSQILDPILHRFITSDGLLLLTNSIISTLIIIIFGEYLPKSQFKKDPNGIMRHLALPIVLSYVVLYPISILCTKLSQGILFLMGKKNQAIPHARLTTIDLDHYLSESYSSDGPSGSLDTEVKIIQNALDFSDVKARDCMVPRNEIVACSLETSLEELTNIFISTGLSKVIVYKESIDDVVGYIHCSEIFKGKDWQERMQSAVYVPDSTYGHKLMKQLMQHKKSIAIVIDEMGGTSGIITLEDLVEEIFGNIEDEHDRKKLIERKIDDNTYIISGRSEIDDLNERFALGLPESDEYNTLAGLILYYNRDIPNSKEVVVVDNFSFKILRSSSTRIELIKLTILEKSNS